MESDSPEIKGRSEKVDGGKKRNHYNLFATILSGFLVGSALVYLAYRIGPEKDEYPTTYLICILGYILGWIIAIMSTPMNKSDEAGLSRFSSVVGTFLSGYILSKCDKVFEKIFEPEILFTTINGPRILLFLCCFGLTFILVFYYRRYKWRFQ